MNTRTLIAGMTALFLSSCSGGEKIAEKSSFDVAAPFSDRSIGRSSEQVIWATDSILIATARNKQIQAFNPDTGKELWSKKFDKSITAMTCNANHVYVALYPSSRGKGSELIRRLETVSGIDTTPKGVPQPFLVQALVWSPELHAMCILANGGLSVYSGDLLSVKTRIPYSGNLPMVTSDGKSILVAETTGSCSVIDPKAGSVSHIYGPPNAGQDNSVAIDAPFLSNAFFSSSGALVRIIDNSWNTGRIYFHNTPKGIAKEADSKNGHAVAAIHWPTKRLAVSGTAKNLILYSTSGSFLEEIAGATTGRTYSLAFSPSGKKIAALSVDGNIKVFASINNKESQQVVAPDR